MGGAASLLKTPRGVAFVALAAGLTAWYYAVDSVPALSDWWDVVLLSCILIPAVFSFDLIVLPLSFASNTYVPTSTLPSWMQTFVQWNPLTHLVAAMRGFFLGSPMGNSLVYTLLWCLGLVVVFMPLALRAYRKKA